MSVAVGVGVPEERNHQERRHEAMRGDGQGNLPGPVPAGVVLRPRRRRLQSALGFYPRRVTGKRERERQREKEKYFPPTEQKAKNHKLQLV